MIVQSPDAELKPTLQDDPDFDARESYSLVGVRARTCQSQRLRLSPMADARISVGIKVQNLLVIGNGRGTGSLLGPPRLCFVNSSRL